MSGTGVGCPARCVMRGTDNVRTLQRAAQGGRRGRQGEEDNGHPFGGGASSSRLYPTTTLGYRAMHLPYYDLCVSCYAIATRCPVLTSVVLACQAGLQMGLGKGLPGLRTTD
eukprot:827278-Rhodomonas_salina.8